MKRFINIFLFVLMLRVYYAEYNNQTSAFMENGKFSGIVIGYTDSDRLLVRNDKDGKINSVKCQYILGSDFVEVK